MGFPGLSDELLWKAGVVFREEERSRADKQGRGVGGRER